VSWTLRAAGPEDAPAMSETVQIGFDGYQAFAPPGWRPPDARAAPEVARARVRLAEPGTWAMIAEAGPLVAGHAGYVPQPGVAGSAHLWQLFVRPPWWGSGVAAALLGEAVAAAVGEGYDRMRFFTPRDQARARAFYEREGFAHTGWEALEESIGLVLVEYARELP
jgi:GNAT superfamily N-acetyltransferase